jgi:hypothetical protein
MNPLDYRDPRGEGKRFARWLNDLRNMSGAYVIRSKTGHEVLYIGESHTGRLAATIKRHFHPWRDKTGREHFTCDPARVEVAVRVTPPGAAVGAQNNLIDRLKPRENTVHSEPPPF